MKRHSLGPLRSSERGVLSLDTTALAGKRYDGRVKAKLSWKLGGGSTSISGERGPRIRTRKKHKAKIQKGRKKPRGKGNGLTTNMGGLQGRSVRGGCRMVR